MIRDKLSKLWDICCFNTLYFNFKYLPIKQAIKLPILVSRRVRIRIASGSITIKGTITTGMIRVGMDSVGIFDNIKSRSIWQVQGNIIFHGRCFLGHGCKISVAPNAILSFGKDFACSAESTISAVKQISIGNKCLFSWDILMMDTDWHIIRDYNHNILNPAKPISIGNNVWVGCRTTITKGVEIADGTIIAAGSIVTKSIVEPNCIFGKNPLQLIKRNVIWSKDK